MYKVQYILYMSVTSEIVHTTCYRKVDIFCYRNMYTNLYNTRKFMYYMKAYNVSTSYNACKA